MYTFCNVVLRVGYDLKPSEAEDYKKAFMKQRECYTYCYTPKKGHPVDGVNSFLFNAWSEL